MSTATRLRRLDETANITVIERSGHVSYANCGLPYFVGGVIEDEDDLLLQTPETPLRSLPARRAGRHRGRRHRCSRPRGHDPLHGRWSNRVDRIRQARLEPRCGSDPPAYTWLRPRASASDRRRCRTTRRRRRRDDRARPWSSARGSSASRPPRTSARKSIAVTVVEAADQVLTPLDPELAILVAAELVSHGVVVETGVAVTEVTASRGRSSRRPGDPRRPRGRVYRGPPRCPSGRDGGPRPRAQTGGIAVDEVNRTSDPDIYAVGDAVEKEDWVGGGSSLDRAGQRRQPSGTTGCRPHLWSSRAPASRRSARPS